MVFEGRSSSDQWGQEVAVVEEGEGFLRCCRLMESRQGRVQVLWLLLLLHRLLR